MITTDFPVDKLRVTVSVEPAWLALNENGPQRLVIKIHNTMQRIVDPFELPGEPEPAEAEQSSVSAWRDWSSSETSTLDLPRMVQDHQSSTDPEMKSIFNLYDLRFGGNQVCFNGSVAAGISHV